jgi:hypothetical protein|nr:hypothetical protein [Candidatus Krumholzibacteria bacterium]
MKSLNLTILMFLVAAGAAVQADEPDTIIFPHDLHFEAEVECATCHEGVAEQTQPEDTFYPDMDVCGDCHDIDDDENCALCHSNVDNAGEYHRGTFQALFSHAPHAGAEDSCARCHGDPTLPAPGMPVKADCRACHETADNFADCGLCHGSEFTLLPADHDAGWISRHGTWASADQASCTLCHTETGCQECHTGDNVRPRSHAFNYAFNHALDARSGSIDCATCHLDPQYCSECHAANRIMPTDHSMAGWVSLSGGGRHATEGLFDLESCVACHDAGAEDPSCIECHGR